MKTELRTLTQPIEVRAAEGGVVTVVGYAALFNVETDIGWFIERVAPGAFDGALVGDVRALIDHDKGRVVGRTKAGTLRLSQDSIGLKVEIDLPATVDGKDIATLIERGDISGMSFGFKILKETWDESGDVTKRIIESVELYEVSIVAFPAYPDTSIAKRSLENFRTEKRQHNFSGARRRLRMKTDLDQRQRGI